MMAIFKKRFASKVLTKADFLTPDKLEGLGVDQLAAIDYLVLRHAAKVVGFPFSSMSAYLRSARYLDGYHPDQTFQLADGSGLLWELGQVGGDQPWENLKIGCWGFYSNPFASRRGGVTPTNRRPARGGGGVILYLSLPAHD